MASSHPSHVFNTDFCLRLAKHIGLEEIEKGSNFVFSPLSMYVVLSMIAAGSKGRTLEQMLSFLNVESIEKLNVLSSQLFNLTTSNGAATTGPVLSLVNGVWVEQLFPLKQAFKDVMNRVYKAEACAVDFQNQGDEVIKEVNAWVRNRTHGLIGELLPPGSVDKSTLLVLANALYFEGSWTKKFISRETCEREFYLLNGNSVHAAFMTNKHKQLLSSFDGFKVLKLPYQGTKEENCFAMYLFLPDERDGLKSLVQNMCSDPEFLNRYTRVRQANAGEFRIPKFKISFGSEATEMFKEMGLDLPFSMQAELHDMVEFVQKDVIFVSDIFHKSFVEVNEEGSLAAAGTGGHLIHRSALLAPPIDFVADHPFMFVIREEASGTALFIGHVLNPLSVT
ncbi:hypothetical protein ACLOJK_038744 [Asimina triloba]